MKTLILILLFSNNSLGKETFELSRKWIFETTRISGWEVKIESKVLLNKKLKKKVIEIFREQLSTLSKVIPPKRLAEIKKIPIWVSNESHYLFRKDEKGTMVYHVDPRWLKKHFLPEKLARSIHLINPNNYITLHKAFTKQPFVTLHELSHAYHHQCLGSDNKVLIDAYDNAIKNKLYLKVSRKLMKKKGNAYAATNVFEYFSELTEAYFGENDFFPFTRKELKGYDPVGFRAIQKSWDSSCKMITR